MDNESTLATQRKESLRVQALIATMTKTSIKFIKITSGAPSKTANGVKFTNSAFKCLAAMLSFLP